MKNNEKSTENAAKTGVSQKLLDILVCPLCKAKLKSQRNSAVVRKSGGKIINFEFKILNLKFCILIKIHEISKNFYRILVENYLYKSNL